jgi:lipoprotein-releasing system ATP-binding protein
MSTMDNLIEAKDVCKSYRMGQTTVKVLEGVDLAVRKGEFLTVVGASGSGKSTLLHLLGGLDRPDRGQVRFRGQDLTQYSGKRINQFRNRTVGFVFQFYHLLEELNISENVLLPAMADKSVLAWLSQRDVAQKRAQELIGMMGLSHRTRHKPYQLSGGERQRVAIARALMNNPELLLADEPTGNLDSATGNSILELLEQLNREGQTIVMVTHDDRIAHKAGRAVSLVDGNTVEGL